jgi:hypothetical protein
VLTTTSLLATRTIDVDAPVIDAPVIDAVAADRVQLAQLVRELGPFANFDRHAATTRRSTLGGAPAVFYCDVEPGRRIELTISEVVTGLSPNSLLMACPHGGWEIFDDDGLVARYAHDVVHVALSW